MEPRFESIRGEFLAAMSKLKPGEPMSDGNLRWTITVYLAGRSDALDPFFKREALAAHCELMIYVGAAKAFDLAPWRWWEE